MLLAEKQAKTMLKTSCLARIDMLSFFCFVIEKIVFMLALGWVLRAVVSIVGHASAQIALRLHLQFVEFDCCLPKNGWLTNPLADQ